MIIYINTFENVRERERERERETWFIANVLNRVRLVCRKNAAHWEGKKSSISFNAIIVEKMFVSEFEERERELPISLSQIVKKKKKKKKKKRV